MTAKQSNEEVKAQIEQRAYDAGWFETGETEDCPVEFIGAFEGVEERWFKKFNWGRQDRKNEICENWEEKSIFGE